MRTIEVPKSEEGILEYLRDYPVLPSVTIVRNENDTRAYFEIRSDIDELEERIFLDAVTDVMSVFYKTRAIMKEIKNLDFERTDVLAYLGTLSAFERGDEKRKIAAAIGGDRYVNLDGLYNFRLDKTIDSWMELGRLAEKLLKECVSADETLELVAFMLGMSKVEGSVRLSRENDVPKIEKSGKIYPVARLTGNLDCDLVFSLLKEAPKSIIVPEPEKFSKNVLSAIRALGE